MPDATTFSCPDLTTFTRLDDLGLEVTGQLMEPDRAVLAYGWSSRTTGADGATARASRETPSPVGSRTRPSGGAHHPCDHGRRYRCAECAHVWRQDTTAAAEPRARISRGGLAWALVGIVCQHLSMTRVAEGLGVSWHTANDAVLAEGRRVLIEDPAGLDGVAVLGVDEHCWRHTRRGDKYVTVIIDLTRSATAPVRRAQLLDMVEGRSRRRSRPGWTSGTRPGATVSRSSPWTGSRGSKTATTEGLPEAVSVMDPFHVVQLAGEAMDDCRRRVQQETPRAPGPQGRPLVLRPPHPAHRRRPAHRQAAGATEGTLAAEEHVAVEATWGIYQRMVAAYREPDRAKGRGMMQAVIESVRQGVPAGLSELRRLGHTLSRRAEDVLAYFDRPRTSNGHRSDQWSP